jgi:hypothetical protein
MPNVYDDIDLAWAWNGDYLLGHTKDLEDTSNDGLRSLIQDIHTVAASAFRDWELYPNLGAGLDDFIGEPNIRSTAEAIHDRLRLAIVSAGIVLEEDLTVRVVPVHRNKLLIVVQVDVMPTPSNKMDSSGTTIRTALVFDFLEQGVFFLDKPPELIGGYY